MLRMETITSAQNPQFKRWKKLLTAKGRKQYKQLILEGVHLVEAAGLQRLQLETILLEEGRELPQELEGIARGHLLTQLPPPLFAQLSQTMQPQGVLAVATIPTPPALSDFFTAEGEQLFILLDEVQDPGNLGTMIRTADAVGATAVLLGKGSVDPYNEKVVRATMGSLFHLPVLQVDLLEVIPNMKEAGIEVLAAILGAQQSYLDLSWAKRTAIVVGNEGNGIRPEVERLVSQRVVIPMYGRAESLNVAIASALLMYEWRRHNQV